MVRIFSILRKKNRPAAIDLSSNEIVIAAGTTTQGNLNTDRDVFVDGDFRGKITTKGYIKLGTNAEAVGELNCRAIRLQGHFNGELKADTEIAVEGGSKFEGSAKARSIEINKDALVNAQLTTLTDSQ